LAQADQNADLTTVTYPVAELVVPFTIHNRDGTKTRPTTEGELMARIYKCVVPASWDGAGGLGSMRFEAKDGYLLHVRQTAAVHAELKAFLDQIQRGQVSLEVRILTGLEKILEKRNFKWMQNDDLEYALLDDIALFQWYQAAQGDPTTHLMQSPKITLLDGQKSKLDVGGWLTFQTGMDVQVKDGASSLVPKNEKVFVGFQSEFLPSISSNRKHVTVQTEIMLRSESGQTALVPLSMPAPGGVDEDGKPNMKKVVQVWVQKPTFNEIKLAVAAKVPDQRTIAIHAGKVLTEVRTESSTPILSRVPYVNRLFRNQAFGRETTSLIILLTPRIITEPETVHIERLRGGIHAEDNGQFPIIMSQSGK
jgi:hypothetical protein